MYGSLGVWVDSWMLRLRVRAWGGLDHGVRWWRSGENQGGREM